MFASTICYIYGYVSFKLCSTHYNMSTHTFTCFGTSAFSALDTKILQIIPAHACYNYYMWFMYLFSFKCTPSYNLCIPEAINN